MRIQPIYLSIMLPPKVTTTIKLSTYIDWLSVALMSALSGFMTLYSFRILYSCIKSTALQGLSSDFWFLGFLTFLAVGGYIFITHTKALIVGFLRVCREKNQAPE